MTKHFDGGAQKFIKKIAKNDISKNKTKRFFSILTITLATTLLMALALFESGYETAKDRLAEGQPQVIFSEVSSQQVSLLRSDGKIESVTVNETGSGYDVLAIVTDATKMTQYGFSSAVNDIALKYGISHVIKNDLFMDSLPDGGLLNQENAAVAGIAVFIVLVSALVIYNIFYLSITNQVQQFGQLRTIGMTKKQVKMVIKRESKLLCRVGIPAGLLAGGLVGYLLQQDGWDWGHTAALAVLITVIVMLIVKISLNKPAKVAGNIPLISSSRYAGSTLYYCPSRKMKRKLSPLGISIISVAANWRKTAVSVFSLGLSGLLFTLAATYSVSIDAKTIVRKEIYQYGQFVAETSGEYGREIEMLNDLIADIRKIPGVNNVKQITETDIEWSALNSTHSDHLSIIKADDFSAIQPFVQDGSMDYQTLVDQSQILTVDGMDGISVGDTVEFIFGDGIRKEYGVGGILDGDIYSDTAIYGGWFLLPKELIPENSGGFVSSIKLVVAADDVALKEVEASLRSLTGESGNWSLATMQDAVVAKDVAIKQVSMSIIGVTMFLLFFSIITFASTVITNIAARKREYAMLQSIGMGCRQVEIMGLGEGFLLTAGSLFITLLLGLVLGRIMITVMINMGVFYLSYRFPLGIFAVYCFSIVSIALLITFSAFRVMQKIPIVDRLRITE